MPRQLMQLLQPLHPLHLLFNYNDNHYNEDKYIVENHPECFRIWMRRDQIFDLIVEPLVFESNSTTANSEREFSTIPV